MAHSGGWQCGAGAISSALVSVCVITGDPRLVLSTWLTRRPSRCVVAQNGGATALLYACKRGHLALVQWLIREGGSSARLERDIVSGRGSSGGCVDMAVPLIR